MADNYQKLYDDSRKLFLTFDQEEMIRHFGLRHDEERFYFHILNRPAELDRATGVITRGGAPIGGSPAMTIYDILSRAKDGPRLSGEWVSITALGGNVAMSHSDKLREDRELKPLAGRSRELARVCRSLGGRPMPQGDVSFVLPFTDFFPVWIQFWDEDEEFPLQLKCMWDANTLRFMFYETTWYLLGYLRQELVRGVEALL